MNKINTIAVVLLLAALWSAPTASAVNSQFDGFYYPVSGSNAGMISAHFHIYGNDGDPSRPTGTITNADGCTINLFQSDPSLTIVINDVGSGFARGEVVSGGGPNCQSSSRLQQQEFKNSVDGRLDYNISDLDNHHSWMLTGPAS